MGTTALDLVDFEYWFYGDSQWEDTFGIKEKPPCPLTYLNAEQKAEGHIAEIKILHGFRAKA